MLASPRIKALCAIAAPYGNFEMSKFLSGHKSMAQNTGSLAFENGHVVEVLDWAHGMLRHAPRLQRMEPRRNFEVSS